MAAKWKALFAGAILGAICTVLLPPLARPSRALLTRLAHFAGREPKADWVDPQHAAPPSTKSVKFFSQAAQQDVSYLIYLPPGYDTEPEKRYPVIYWLHSRGGTQQEGAYTFVPRMDSAIRSGLAPPVIIVLPNGIPFIRWSDTSDGKLPVETVFIHDLIPYVDRTYRTLATRRYRAIEGFSMGGFGAAHLAFKYPEVFGTIALDSAALFEETSDDRYLEVNSPWNLAVRNAAVIREGTVIRIAVGRDDSLLDLNRDFHLLLQSLGISHEFFAFPGVGHNGEDLYRSLGPRLASFYRDAFADDRPTDPASR